HVLCLRSSITLSSHRLALPSFPTRRSSDLANERHAAHPRQVLVGDEQVEPAPAQPRERLFRRRAGLDPPRLPLEREAQHRQHRRSEEHTSELQSPCNLVCRLLLEKKKSKFNGRPSGRTSPHNQTIGAAAARRAAAMPAGG